MTAFYLHYFLEELPLPLRISLFSLLPQKASKYSKRLERKACWMLDAGSFFYRDFVYEVSQDYSLRFQTFPTLSSGAQGSSRSQYALWAHANVKLLQVSLSPTGGHWPRSSPILSICPELVNSLREGNYGQSRLTWERLLSVVLAQRMIFASPDC